MDDKQIIELYWNRSDEAIKETKEKYGQYCSYIAHHILQEEAVAERCVEECYAMLWDSIPPRKPQNLKAYLCKITRNHALHMRYPELNEQANDLFTAELMIQEFLKGLEPEQRKLFVAHYWYFVPVSEIALQYKKSEKKVNATLVSLREKLDDVLVQKGIQLQSEAQIFYAMTEIDDKYLEEAEPQMSVAPKVACEENGENQNRNSKQAFSKYWKKYQIPILACSLCFILVVLIWPKHPVEQNPTESESESEPIIQEPIIIVPDIDWESLITIQNEVVMMESDFAERIQNLPWNKDMEVAALPIYKNLACQSEDNVRVYLDEGTLIARAEAIAEQLNMDVISSVLTTVGVGENLLVDGINMTTDLGSISINGAGEVLVTYTNGVKLSNGNVMSDNATTEEANKTVEFLLQQYASLLLSSNWVPNSYPDYNVGVREMNYQAVSRAYGSNPIVEYYFNQVKFYYDERRGMTCFRYGDARTAAELVGYYPITSYEEAKNRLLQGEFVTIEFFEMPDFDIEVDYGLVEDDDIRAVELMYEMNPQNEYYQPYYCFYVQLEDRKEYVKCYVPAVKGAGLNRTPPETETVIMNMLGYEKVDDLLYMGGMGQYYTFENGQIKELVDYEHISLDYRDEFGEIVEENGTTYFYHKELEERVNLTQLLASISSINPDSIDAKYIDGKVLITCTEYLNGYAHISCYVYSTEEKSLHSTAYRVLGNDYSTNEQVNGLMLNGGRYATYGNVGEYGKIVIFDMLDGSVANTSILCSVIKLIIEASDSHYAVVYKTGNIDIIEKETGKLVKRTKERISFTPSDIAYKNGVLYVDAYGVENLLFVIDEFE